jgi:hypothetical protein
MFLTAGITRGEEKYWKAHQASLIVVGTLDAHPTFPWFDGWHLTGRIDVEEVLFGPRPPGKIAFRFVCEYAQCRNWPPPSFPDFLREKGMWFLRPLDARSWQPSAGGIGFADLSERSNFEDYIRRVKRKP